MKNITVIGLGLIGGSAAKAVKRNPGIVVTGWDINNEVCKKAVAEGIIDNIWDGSSIIDTDLIVIATPPQAAVDFLKNNARFIKKGTVVTDMCGVKRAVVYECERICSEHGLLFAGGHPMAGKEKGGLQNSTQSLFENASYIITATSQTTPEAMNTVWLFTTLLGTAKPTVCSPEKHDSVIAYTSQLPHILAGAYVKSPSINQRKGFSAGSFMDVSRVATADEKLWSQLFLLNRDNLCTEIDTLIKNLSEYKKCLCENDTETLASIIAQSRDIKEKDSL